MALEFAHGNVRWLAADAVNTDYTVSGLAFQPKALRFYWAGLGNTTDGASETAEGRRGMGFAVSTSARRAVTTWDDDGAAAGACGSVALNDCVAATVNLSVVDGKLDLHAINSDGFVLRVDDQGVIDLQIFWEAWGGSDVTAAGVGDIAEPSATGTQNYTVSGFTSDGANQVVFLAGVQSINAVGTGEAEASGFYVGIATSTSSSSNIVVTGNLDNGPTTMDADGYCNTGTCLAQIAIAGDTVNAEAALSAWGTDLFTLNWSLRARTNRRSIYMGVKGGLWNSGSYTIDAGSAGNTATVSGLSYSPIGVCLMGRCTAEQTSPTPNVNDRIGLGTGSSTSSRRSAAYLSEDATADSNINLVIEFDQVLSFPTTAGALDAAYDIDAITSDGFRVIVDDVPASASSTEWQGYLAFGNAAAAQDTPELYGRPYGLRGAQQVQQLLSQ